MNSSTILLPGRVVREQARYIRELGTINGIRAFWGTFVFRSGVKNFKVPGIGRPMVVRTNNSDGQVFRDVFISRRFEPIYQLIGWEPRLIVDGGAYCGYSAAMFASHYPAAQVLAVEPDKDNFAILLANAIPGVRPLYAGLSNRSGRLKIVDPGGGKWAIRTEAAHESDPDSVRAITIPELMEMAEERTLDILKLNVEGAEKVIFADGFEWLSRTQVLMIDLHDKWVRGCSEVVYKATREFGFKRLLLDRNGEHVLFSRDG